MTNNANNPADLTYEQALAELEEIVGMLEENQPSLEEAIALYERGQALAQRCATLLDTAETRLSLLKNGELIPMNTNEEG